SHPRAVLNAIGNFLRREVYREVSATDMRAVQRATFQINISQIEPTQIGIAQIGVAKNQFVDIDVPQIDAPQIGMGKIDLLAARCVLSEVLVIVRSQIAIGRIVDDSWRCHEWSPTTSIAHETWPSWPVFAAFPAIASLDRPKAYDLRQPGRAPGAVHPEF